MLFFCFAFAQEEPSVYVKNDNDQMTLIVNGEKFVINGMNWDYIPRGENYTYSLWRQSESVIKAALDSEMMLLKNMGVNAIRQYSGIPAKWVKYIYENYGIYTMLNHSFGRYGVPINGTYVPNTDYGEEQTRDYLLNEVATLAQEYKGTPGLLLYMLGNENNYGLFWGGAETEDIPVEQRKSTKRATDMYKLFNEGVLEIKKYDTTVPVAMCNGDNLFIEIIAEECKDIDIYGTNMYRGIDFTDAFKVIKKQLNKPMLFAEFGSDAFNARTLQEDQLNQAKYMVENWKDIYNNVSGQKGAGNCLGGFTFQFSDGWWKFGQTENLNTHDTNASWSNGGYKFDHVEGENNMNEEWFGVVAKGETNAAGLYESYPRAAYYALKEVHKLNPLKEGVDSNYIDSYFDNIQYVDAVLKARGDKAVSGENDATKIKLTNLRAEFSTFLTGGSNITTPEVADPTSNGFPTNQGFDQMESYYIGVQGKPASNVITEVNFNILGNVATNPINEIFYENRGRLQNLTTNNGSIISTSGNRLAVYNAKFEWDSKNFKAKGFYRNNHSHWQYEGDFFGLYQAAIYGPNLDIYNGQFLGFEFEGKKKLKGLKAAFGPNLWWGANPAIFLKYQTKVKGADLVAVFHRDVDQNQPDGSGVVPLPETMRASVYAKKNFGKLNLELGGIWGGQPLNGRSFQILDSNGVLFDDEIQIQDNFGGKAKLTYSGNGLNVYAQGAYMGLVANGSADATQTFTGWTLKDSGSGNQTNFLTGFTYGVGNFQVAPNFLWQKPLVGAMSNDSAFPSRLRNIQDDPFAVRANRETVGAELLLTWDPTPGTWMYMWDNDRAEDAKFAASLDLVYRHLPTNMDAAIGFGADRTQFAFPTSTPAEDLWEANLRVVNKLSKELGFITTAYVGNAQADGNSDRTINRMGLNTRAIYKKVRFDGSFKLNDWGPYDYHRVFNLTYPLQAGLDVSTTIGKPDWFILPGTKIGIQGTYRTLDEYSPRIDDSTTGANEWEIRTYVHINIGQ